MQRSALVLRQQRFRKLRCRQRNRRPRSVHASFDCRHGSISCECSRAPGVQPSRARCRIAAPHSEFATKNSFRAGGIGRTKRGARHQLSMHSPRCALVRLPYLHG